MRKTPSAPFSDRLKTLIEQTLDENKAEHITVIDLHGKSSFADYMIVATGRSPRHIASLAEHVTECAEVLGANLVSTEGLGTCDWVLVDTGDVVVHIFRPEVRPHYNLEKMWAVDVTAPLHATV